MEIIVVIVCLVLLGLFGFHAVLVPLVVAVFFIFAPIWFLHRLADRLEPGHKRLRAFLTHEETGAAASVLWCLVVGIFIYALFAPAP